MTLLTDWTKHTKQNMTSLTDWTEYTQHNMTSLTVTVHRAHTTELDVTDSDCTQSKHNRT